MVIVVVFQGRYSHHKTTSDRIRLPNTFSIRPEDVILQGPNVSYNEQVTTEGGGKNKYPNTDRHVLTFEFNY